MNLKQVLEQMKNDPRISPNITAWHYIPPQEAKYADFPEWLSPQLRSALNARGIVKLYSHQRQALDAVRRGKDIVVVTPTASGKTLCYNLPVLQRILEDESARALYIFPTKALSQDQVAELLELSEDLSVPIKTYTYDGDTPGDVRRAIRTAGHIVVTNPDMLHTGILPHHTKWMKLFENLQYIVIDEMHTYRGVFGSHFANVLRRLMRICDFYGSKPQFILSSATIHNPADLAKRLTGRDVTLINQNGAPAGEKHIIFYNPPVVNRELGIRKSSLLVGRDLAANFLKNDIPTIVFAKSRMNVEILVTYLKEALQKVVRDHKIRGYRGGYLPKERRAIESGLRHGEVLGVVSTNALELGIDIGSLDVAVMVGYPGSVASTWQQSGRAGRRSGTSAAVMIASSAPLDQFMITHPAYFFGQPPEYGLINPNNLPILLSHIKCAAFELPFADGEKFGVETTEEILAFLEEEGVLRHVGHRWHWMADNFPAEEISLRSAAAENVVIIDTSPPAPRVIGEIDRFGAMTMVHEDAIYIHEGQQYQVEKLDFKELKAYVKKVDVDYYTDANLAVSLKVLDPMAEEKSPQMVKGYGDVMVTALATIFKKIKFHTHENIGWGKIRLPEEEMHTTGCWLAVPEEVSARFSRDEVEKALVGLSNVMVNLAPLYLLCDPRDIRVVCEVKSTYTLAPTLTIYDHYPGGVGLAEKLYDLLDELLRTAYNHIRSCPCARGCPSCVGPAMEVGEKGKELTLRLLEEVLCDGPQG